MAPIIHEIEIDRSPEEVFALATDPTRFPEWQEDVRSARWEGVSTGVGARFSSTRRIAGRDVTQTQEVVESDAPKRWAARGVDGPIRAPATVVVEPLDDGARSHVTFGLDFEGPGVGRLMVPQVRRIAAKRAPGSQPEPQADPRGVRMN
jgi:uncharacterized protein YndB with AHSA1/START domain